MFDDTEQKGICEAMKYKKTDSKKEVKLKINSWIVYKSYGDKDLPVCLSQSVELHD